MVKMGALPGAFTIKFYWQMAAPPDPSPVSVTRETTLSVAPALAWALIRDFDAMPAWNSSVRQSRIEDGPADRVGCLRVLVFDDTGIWTHQLTGLSDEDMKLQYRIVGTPQPMRLPVWNYRAEMRVVPVGVAMPGNHHTGCTIVWRADFETAHADDMVHRAAQVFDLGFAGLRQRLGLLG